MIFAAFVHIKPNSETFAGFEMKFSFDDFVFCDVHCDSECFFELVDGVGDVFKFFEREYLIQNVE